MVVVLRLKERLIVLVVEIVYFSSTKIYYFFISFVAKPVLKQCSYGPGRSTYLPGSHSVQSAPRLAAGSIYLHLSSAHGSTQHTKQPKPRPGINMKLGFGINNVIKLIIYIYIYI